jgi:hypothetical protein
MPRKKTVPPAQAPLKDLKTPDVRAPGPAPTLAACADVHLANHARWGGPLVDGLNRRGRETVATLERAIQTAEHSGCQAFAVAGDLFNSRRPEPALIAAVQRVFSSTKMACLIIPGNHDALDASTIGGNTACAPLWRDATVVNESTWFQIGGLAILAIPFDARQPMADWIGAEVERLASSRPAGEAVLLTHVGVYDEEQAPPWQVKAKDAMPAEAMLRLLEAQGFTLALVGNYHNHLQRGGHGEPIVCQIGTLCPASFSDPEAPVGGMAYVAPGQTPWLVQIPGPRFQRTPRADLANFQPMEECSYYLRVTGEPPPGFTNPPGVVHVDWVQEAALGAAQADASPAQDPEAALREACADAPKGMRDPVEDLVMQAWRAGA